MNGTYEVEKLSYANFLWVPVADSWSPYNSSTMTGVDSKLLFGIVSIENQFKLTVGPSWSDGDYGYSYFLKRQEYCQLKGAIICKCPKQETTS